MFSIGWGELLIVAGIALFFIGPQQLPGLARRVGKIVRDLTKARDEWLDIFRNDESIKDIRDSINDVKGSAAKPVQEFKQALEKRLKELEEDSRTEKFKPAETTQPMSKTMKDKKKLDETEVMAKNQDDVLDESTELYYEGESPRVNDETDKMDRPDFAKPAAEDEEPQK